ncbi:uncharacterized protein LOC134261149, partial [Saccostrea cucullata]|uniref:uncharacterized protein LOC134261149 n=1 Tax=Saccostrea cuccullata TaxID=36930 RepID=UPI002ED0EC30
MDPCTSAQDVIRCDLCETAMVQMHCDTCLVNMCKACVGDHMVSDESQKHDIVRFALRKSTPLYPRCTSHVKERCEIEIDKIVNKLNAEVDEMKITQLQNLQNHMDGISKRISEIKEEINAVEQNVNSKDISKLLKVTSGSIVAKYRNLPQKFVTYLPRFIPERIEGKNLIQLFGILSPSSLTADEHGYSLKTTEKLPEAGSSPSVKQLLDEPEIVSTIDIDTGYRHLHNVACLSDEEIWTSGNDSTMKLYSINQGSLLKSIKTKSGSRPEDIAVTKSGDLVYTDYSDRT